MSTESTMKTPFDAALAVSKFVTAITAGYKPLAANHDAAVTRTRLLEQDRNAWIRARTPRKV